MPEAIGWGGVVLAIVAMIRGEWSASTARKTVRDKADSDRLAAFDKMQFDAELQSLKVHHAACAVKTEQMEADLKKCSEQHATSETDRAEMKGRLAVMETLLASTLLAKTNTDGGK